MILGSRLYLLRYQCQGSARIVVFVDIQSPFEISVAVWCSVTTEATVSKGMNVLQYGGTLFYG